MKAFAVISATGIKRGVRKVLSHASAALPRG